MSIESGSPSDLAGLLVVNPDQGNERPDADSGNSPAADADTAGSEAEVNWDDADGEHDNADDATGADETQTEDDGSAEAEGSDEPQPEDEASYEVAIGGETKKVTLKEALAGYQRQEDYTRKTQEVAAAREALTAETEAARAHRASYKQVLDALEAKLGPANQEPTAEQWEQLKAEQPEQYAIQWADYQRRAEQRATLKAEKDRVANEETQEQRKALQNYVDGERVKLLDAMPQWKGKDGKIDAAKMTADIKEVRDYAAKTLGYTEQELNQAYDHRMILLARKAMLHDRAEAARKAAKAKLAGAPELPAPGSRVPQRNAKGKAQEEAQKKFARTGKVDDAVSLILA
jgi:hypothetical protein